MSPKIYQRTSETNCQAMQWTLDNKADFLNWLNEKGIGYTYHDIASGGQLFINLPNISWQLDFGHYFVIEASGRVTSYDQNTFKNLFIEVIS